MNSDKRDLRIISFFFCVGVAWLLIHLLWNVHIEICPIKRLIGVPCPSCGTTRAFKSLFAFDVVEALKYNINILILLPSIVTYVALRVYDLIFHTQKLEQVYNKVKEMLNKKLFFCAFILFEILAWTLHISLR